MIEEGAGGNNLWERSHHTMPYSLSWVRQHGVYLLILPWKCECRRTRKQDTQTGNVKILKHYTTCFNTVTKHPSLKVMQQFLKTDFHAAHHSPDVSTVRTHLRYGVSYMKAKKFNKYKKINNIIQNSILRLTTARKCLLTFPLIGWTYYLTGV